MPDLELLPADKRAKILATLANIVPMTNVQVLNGITKGTIGLRLQRRLLDLEAENERLRARPDWVPAETGTDTATSHPAAEAADRTWAYINHQQVCACDLWPEQCASGYSDATWSTGATDIAVAVALHWASGAIPVGFDRAPWRWMLDQADLIYRLKEVPRA